MRGFRNLQIWSRSHELTVEIYGVASQMRHSSSSVPSNIAKGCRRGSDKDFNRFLQISMGSASELDYQLILASDLGYLSEVEFCELSGELTELKKILHSFNQALKAKA